MRAKPRKPDPHDLHGSSMARGTGQQGFDRVLDMVQGVTNWAWSLLYTRHAYRRSGKKTGRCRIVLDNHNLDTSSDYYGDIITTRTYNDRLQTLDNVRRRALCLLRRNYWTRGNARRQDKNAAHLCTLPEHPEVCRSIPWCCEGTPLENNSKTDVWDM